nr:MAG TPA: hypothetical protein [Caudoviricetes sp.]
MIATHRDTTGTTGFEPVTSQFPKQDLIRLPYIH